MAANGRAEIWRLTGDIGSFRPTAGASVGRRGRAGSAGDADDGGQPLLFPPPANKRRFLRGALSSAVLAGHREIPRGYRQSTAAAPSVIFHFLNGI